MTPEERTHKLELLEKIKEKDQLQALRDSLKRQIDATKNAKLLQPPFANEQLQRSSSHQNPNAHTPTDDVGLKDDGWIVLPKK